MRVLMLTPYLPYPPSSGGQIRSYNLIKELSKKHEITLYSLIKNERERRYVGELKKYCKTVKVFKRAQKAWTLSNILSTGFSVYPFLVIRNFSDGEKKDVAKLLEKEQFDIIHAETFYVSPHIPRTQTPIVLVDQAIEYQVYQHFVETFKWWFLKPLLWIDVAKIKYWESHYWKRAKHVIAVSARDAQSMNQLVPHQKISVVPNPVGEDLMGNVPLHFSQTILFMGNYAWLQNVEAAQILARDIFPLIIKKVPSARLLIAGQNAEKILSLQNESITVTDIAIDDIRGVKKAYHTCGIMVAPLYGPSGSRVKLVGAMAAKLPVVTTTIGIEGIDAKDGGSALIADSYQAIADKAIKLLTDKKLYTRIALNARKLVEEKYAYTSIAKMLDHIYEEAASEN